MRPRTAFIAVIYSALAASPLLAVEEHHPEKQQNPTQASPAPSDKQAQDKQSTQMQERMKKMQEQMQQIQQAKDPKERQKLMQEHMQTMHEQMMDMRGMGGGMMMGRMDGHDGKAHGDDAVDAGAAHAARGGGAVAAEVAMALNSFAPRRDSDGSMSEGC